MLPSLLYHVLLTPSFAPDFDRTGTVLTVAAKQGNIDCNNHCCQSYFVDVAFPRPAVSQYGLYAAGFGGPANAAGAAPGGPLGGGPLGPAPGNEGYDGGAPDCGGAPMPGLGAP